MTSLLHRSASTRGIDRESVLDDVLEEVANRLQAGEPVDRAAILAKYPEHAESLLRLLPAVEVMAEFGVSASRLAARGVPPGVGPFENGLGELGDFRILREIGRGGMGVVYEAEQISLGRRVALKVLPFAAALDSHQLQRFKTEAQAAAQLHHTNIVPVYCVGCERGVHYFAMQYIEGQTLAQAISERRRSETPPSAIPPSPLVGEGGPKGRMGREWDRPHSAAQPSSECGARAESSVPRSSAPMPSASSREYFRAAAELGIQAAEALDHAHKFGIVHRDIKPANLLLDIHGNLWITDFGLARLQDDGGLTITGDLLGTLRYMSPEQALAKRGYLDHRTDIYSLGATLYELVTLHPAIDGQDRQEVLRKIAQDEPTPPRRLNSSIPRELETILLKAMNKEPGSRYSTAQELADDLYRVLVHEPIRARRPSAFEKVSKWVRRHPSIVIATLATLLTTAFILAIAIILVVREQAAAQEALKRLRDEQENATRFAATAKTQSERAGLRSGVALQSAESMLLRLSDGSLPNTPQIQELRRSFGEHAQSTIEGFIDASDRDPDVLAESVGAYHHLANFHFVGGRITECRTNFSNAIRLNERLVALDPHSSRYLWLLGNSHNAFALALYASGIRTEAIVEFHEARSNYLRALELDPASFEALRRLRWFLAIAPEPELRDPGRVLELTATMIEQEKTSGPVRRWDPSRSPHWLLRGLALYRNGAFTSAIDILDGPLHGRLHETEALYGVGDLVLGGFVLAMAYQRAGDCARALDSYQTALRLMETGQSRNAEAMIFRAEAEALLGVSADPKTTEKKEQKVHAQSKR